MIQMPLIVRIVMRLEELWWQLVRSDEAVMWAVIEERLEP